MVDQVEWLGLMPGDRPEDVCTPYRPDDWPDPEPRPAPPMLPPQTHPGMPVKLGRYGLFIHRPWLDRLLGRSERA